MNRRLVSVLPGLVLLGTCDRCTKQEQVTKPDVDGKHARGPDAAGSMRDASRRICPSGAPECDPFDARFPWGEPHIGQAGEPASRTKCRHIQIDLELAAKAPCETNDDCLSTDTCVVVAKANREQAAQAEAAWRKAGCGDFPECRVIKPLCYGGGCVQPWQSHLYESARRIPKGIPPRTRMDRKCVWAAFRSAIGSCCCGHEYSATLPLYQVAFELELQPGKVEAFLITSSTAAASMAPFKGTLESCIEAEVVARGGLKCFEGGWTKVTVPHFACPSSKPTYQDVGEGTD